MFVVGLFHENGIVVDMLEVHDLLVKNLNLAKISQIPRLYKQSSGELSYMNGFFMPFSRLSHFLGPVTHQQTAKSPCSKLDDLGQGGVLIQGQFQFLRVFTSAGPRYVTIFERDHVNLLLHSAVYGHFPLLGFISL